MRKSNSFKVPEKYFENIDFEILEKLKFKKMFLLFRKTILKILIPKKLLKKKDQGLFTEIY